MKEQLVLDDGLLMDDVGAWCEDKYRLVGLYIHLFATGMKAKWEKRVYIDLYSGAGISRIRGTAKLVMGSPLIALNAKDPFDLYIFCDVNQDKLDALKQRAEKIGTGRKIEYVPGDCNSTVDTICRLIPRHSRDNKVLSLCFADPYDIGIKFSTIRKLSSRFLDLLILLAYMDPNRAHLQYLNPDNKKVDEFLDLPGWRKIWEREKEADRGLRLPDFLARQYAKLMSRLRYRDQELHMMRKVRSDDKILRYTGWLYSHVAKQLINFGNRFWNTARTNLSCSRRRMALHSTIEWTQATWNPVRGCTKISAGCKHCYAERFAERFRGVAGHPYEQGFDLRLVPERLADPLRWSEPRMIFVNSMSDLFQPGVPDHYISRVFDVMKVARWHTFQVLTKRASRMCELLANKLAEAGEYDHVWWGVSVENKRDGLPGIEHLRRAKVPVKFLSIEPLLENLGTIDLSGMSWVIVGGESGPGARPMEKEWALSIRSQCRTHGIPFFFKQWGGIWKSRRGRRLEGRIYNERPKTKTYPVLARTERLAYVTGIERFCQLAQG